MPPFTSLRGQQHNQDGRPSLINTGSKEPIGRRLIGSFTGRLQCYFCGYKQNYWWNEYYWWM